MANIGTVEAILGADTRQWTAGLKSAETQMRTLESTVKRSDASMKLTTRTIGAQTTTLRAGLQLWSSAGLGLTAMGKGGRIAADSMGLLTTALAAGAGPIGAVVAGLSALTVVIARFVKAQKEAEQATRDHLDAIQKAAEQTKFASEAQARAALENWRREREVAMQRIATIKETLAAQQEAERVARTSRFAFDPRDQRTGALASAARLSKEETQQLREELNRLQQVAAIAAGAIVAADHSLVAFRRSAEDAAKAAREARRAIFEEMVHQAELDALVNGIKQAVREIERLTTGPKPGIVKTGGMLGVFTMPAPEVIVRQVRAINAAIIAENDRAEQLRRQRVLDEAEAAAAAWAEAALSIQMSLTNALTAAFTGRAEQAAAAFGDVLQSAFAFAGGTIGGPVGGVVGGVLGGIVSSLMTFGDAAAEAARQVARAEREWRSALEDFANMFADPSLLDQAERAFQQVVERFLSQHGIPLIGDDISIETARATARHRRQLAQRDDITDEARERFLREAEELEAIIDIYLDNLERVREEIAKQAAAFEDELHIRLLVAQGQDEAADAIRRQIRLEEDLARARELGIDEGLVRAVHAEEELALARAKAAEEAAKVADSIRQAALLLAEAQAFFDDIDLQLLELEDPVEARRERLRRQAEARKDRLAELFPGDDFFSQNQRIAAEIIIDKWLAAALAAVDASIAAGEELEQPIREAARSSRAQNEIVRGVQSITATQATTLTDIARSQLVKLDEISFNTRALRGDGVAVFPGRATPAVAVTVNIPGTIITAGDPGSAFRIGQALSRGIAAGLDDELGTNIAQQNGLTGITTIT